MSQTTFFSIDVETSDTDLGEGDLLSIGGIAVRWTPGEPAQLVDDQFYVRIDCEDILAHRGWFDGTCTTGTYRWWIQQNDVAQDEAWRDRDLVRLNEFEAAAQLAAWATRVDPEGPRFFVANPVAFDKPWIDLLLSVTGTTNPFHYRSLCLRSMKFGMTPKSGFGSDREDHDPVIPHHPLHDAHAQALDLVAMLARRDGLGV